MSVADMVTSEGIVPYQTVCRLVGCAPNRILQYNVVRTAVRTFLHNFDIKALNIALTEIPFFHDEKVYTARNFRKKLVEIKAAEPCAIIFWKKKCNFKIEKKTHVVAELKMYTGD